jgi:alkaline phosphatase D
LRSRFDSANRMRIWGESGFGDLIDFTLLDGRQYRSRLACSPVDRQEATSAVIAKCEELKDPARTMLGPEQERFVSSQYMQPPYIWSVLVQQTLFSELNQTNRAGEATAYTDGWGGYAPARQRIIDVMSARAKTSNAVVVGGDMHAFWASDVKADFANPNSPTVATEFVTTSVTSHSYAYDRFTRMLPDNPHIKFFDDRVRGYCLADVTRTSMSVKLRSVDSVWRRDIPFRTLKNYVVSAGKPGVQEA